MLIASMDINPNVFVFQFQLYDRNWLMAIAHKHPLPPWVHPVKGSPGLARRSATVKRRQVHSISSVSGPNHQPPLHILGLIKLLGRSLNCPQWCPVRANEDIIISRWHLLRGINLIANTCLFAGRPLGFKLSSSSFNPRNSGLTTYRWTTKPCACRQ